MPHINTLAKLDRYIKRLNGCSIEYDLSPYHAVLDKIKSLAPYFKIKTIAAECTSLALFHHDKHWSRYLAEMTEIREGIHLRKMGGLDPLYEFQKLSIHIFEVMRQHIEDDMAKAFG
ncbi:MAG TPA: hypothetical protein VLX68_09565 [Chitinivibrionales bacterium]|nr:hypothetical protein [Chitinivibrionales bacterium]